MSRSPQTPQQRRFSFPIRVHLFVAIISFVLLLGLLLGGFHYQKISQLVIGEAQRMFDRVAQDVVVKFNGTYQPVNSTVDLLSFSALLSDQNYQTRAERLPLLISALNKIPEMTALEVGYRSKEYFIVRKLNTDYLKLQFNAPQGAHYVIDNIETDTGVGLMHRYYYDQAQQPLVVRDLGQTPYDPTARPWFQLAEGSDQVVSTRPYFFYFIGQVGITVARYRAESGSVVAADITLQQLSDTLARSRVTPSTKLFLIDQAQQVLATSHAESLVREGTLRRTEIKKIDELDDATLESFLAQPHADEEANGIVEVADGEWIAARRKVELAGDVTLSLIILVPKAELLSEALLVRNQSIVITILIVLLSIPAALMIATRISRPLKELARQTSQVRRFDFNQPVSIRSAIVEIGQLGYSMQLMQDTIKNFVEMIKSVAGERDFDRLLEKITQETVAVSSASGAIVYLMNEAATQLVPACCMTSQGHRQHHHLIPLDLTTKAPFIDALASQDPLYFSMGRANGNEHFGSHLILDSVELEAANVVAFPLRNRQFEQVGILCLLFDAKADSGTGETVSEEKIEFVNAVAGFSALTIESGQMVQAQKNLLEAFIKLIAGAIDEKSPYTGGHCQRVPVLTKMIAQAACNSDEVEFADFSLSKAQWEELHIASWLHDCGKVTTPEYVVDKSTKLETLYDRIHEIRMRFEVIKRERELDYWKAVAKGASETDLAAALQADLKQLDEEFAFVAECNVGGEYMAPDRIERIKAIANRRWLRTLDDRLGVSWEELQRKSRAAPPPLPVAESLLADREDHIIDRADAEYGESDNPWGFKLKVPRHKYNRGEIYNLTIEKGTLSEEERFIINNHIVQTIIMLNKLPFPRQMRSIPDIAGGHHEKMDGSGYPKRLRGEQMPLTAKMMAIADIFEALTASDRPYKKAKSLSEALQIMSVMKAEAHIDGDLFALFLRSGVYREYAEQFLLPEQIDEVDIAQLLG